ncbi:MAG: HAMP domain-containing histidine kinase [Lachnospira sp.]|nr:HAMP domain-containing histidine kinase [Lachnospira sp.]
MINNNDYKTIQELKNSNPDAFNALTNATTAHLDALGHASHEIKNMVSFMSSSYQLISLKHPETSEFRFWKEFGSNIEHLVNFMDRTSIYRYCMKYKLEPANIADILYSLPDLADNRHPTDLREFNFDIDPCISQSATIMADKENITMALNEIIDNCYDATVESDTITISAHTECTGIESNPTVTNYIHITISNQGTFPDIEYSEPGETPVFYEPTDADILCKPFYTTRPKRSGLGLSIAYTVCTNHNGELTFTQQDNISSVHVRLPFA